MIGPRKKRGVRCTGSRETCAWCPARHRLTPRGAGLTPDTDSRWTSSSVCLTDTSPGRDASIEAGAAATSREVSRSPSAWFLAKPGLFGAQSSLLSRRLPFGSVIATASAKSDRHDRHRNSDGSFTCRLRVTDPGGTGQPGSAAPFKRRAYRPAFLPSDTGYPFYRATRSARAGFLSEAFAGSDAAMTSLNRLSLSSPDFRCRGETEAFATLYSLLVRNSLVSPS